MQKLLLASFFLSCLCVFSFAQNPTPTPSSGSGNGTGRGTVIGNGSGVGSGNGPGSSSPMNKETDPANSAPTVGMQILEKPRANYTDEARKNGVEGVVRLRVTFLANGEIGSITPVTGLPFGLTEQAIAAARTLRFTPASRNGIAVSVTKIIEYGFSIYYREDDENLAKNAEILDQPAAERPSAENLREISGKVTVTITLLSDGTIRVFEAKTDLPTEFAEKAKEAAAKIKFNPAMHKNGKNVSQRKEIEYEFSSQN